MPVEPIENYLNNFSVKYIHESEVNNVTGWEITVLSLVVGSMAFYYIVRKVSEKK